MSLFDIAQRPQDGHTRTKNNAPQVLQGAL